ncbi:type I 3-dehydroquinate dehydratase [Thermocrinis minervae]|uniref:3-dehydroquinate dehydratase n=1 Tax=Thermocrinis minervae TaxID=381751 RepID=A0A1M6SJD7_9AQUI|nr:type I 3-dehydroquinate dehydratase [Thermocrinis minervae]SHK44884.1 3-dehydroquinate dehydratase [Thermocrinis minervae]
MLVAVPISDVDFQKKLQECKSKGADLVELRVDLFENKDPKHVLHIVNTARELGLGTILTVRSPKEGGREVPNRLEIFREVSPYSDYTDIELSSLDILPEVRKIVKSAGRTLIISYHNFDLTPADYILREVFREARRFGADVIKVAVMARSYEDTARLLCLGRQEEGKKILIAMGKYGILSRIGGFVFGSVITYAFLGEKTAEGQLSLDQMVELKKILL